METRHSHRKAMAAGGASGGLLVFVVLRVLLDLLGFADMVESRTDDPGVMGDVARFVVDFPSGLLLAMVLLGLWLLWVYQYHKIEIAQNETAVARQECKSADGRIMELERTVDDLEARLDEMRRPIVSYLEKGNLNNAVLHLTNLIGHDELAAQVIGYGRDPDNIEAWASTMCLEWATGDNKHTLAHGARGDLRVATLLHNEGPDPKPRSYELFIRGEPGSLKSVANYAEGDSVTAHTYLVVQMMATRAERVQCLYVRLTVTNDSSVRGPMWLRPDGGAPWLVMKVGDSVDDIRP